MKPGFPDIRKIHNLKKIQIGFTLKSISFTFCNSMICGSVNNKFFPKLMARIGAARHS